MFFFLLLAVVEMPFADAEKSACSVEIENVHFSISEQLTDVRQGILQHAA